MNADLLIICPTRGRDITQFLEAFTAARQGDTHLLIAIDDDDSKGGTKEIPDKTAIMTGPRLALTPKLNRYAVPAADSYLAVGFLADDTIPHPGFDIALLEALPITGGIAVPGNHTRADGVGEHEVISSNIIRAFSWYHHPAMAHYYTDNVWGDLGITAGCYRHADCIIEHHRARDQTCRDAETQGQADGAAYRTWRDGNGFTIDLATLKQVIGP